MSEAVNRNEEGPRLAHLVLCGSTLVMGACGLVYEYVLSLLGNYMMGSSHEQIFVVIGIMMFAMGVGAAAQRGLEGHLVDRFLLLELLLGVLGGTSALIIHAAFVTSEIYRVILYGLAFLIGACIGLEIPILMRINEKYRESLRINIAEILSLDYVGALIGALLFTYYLLRHFSLAQIAAVLGLANVFVAAVGLAVFQPLVKRRKLIAATTAAATLLLAACLIYAPAWTLRLEQRMFQDPIVSAVTSDYQHIIVTRRGLRTRMYINGHLQFSSVDEHIYHEMLVHPAMSVAPKKARVLVLGGGDGLAVRELLRYRAAEEIVLVDLDPEIIRLAQQDPEIVKQNEGSLLDPRVRARASAAVEAGEAHSVSVLSERDTKLWEKPVQDVAQVRLMITDADRFLRDVDAPADPPTPAQYDVVIIDFPDPNNLAVAKLYTVGFYRALMKKLAPGGVIAMQASSAYYTRDAYLCIGETLRAAGLRALPYHQVVPSFGDWGFYLAWRQDTLGDKVTAAIAALEGFEVPTKFITPEVLRASLVFGQDALVPKAALQPNTRMQPGLARLYHEGWRAFD